MDAYLSCNRKRISFEIEKSVFLGTVCPVRTEAEAVAEIGKIREEFPDATHHCYAYICEEGHSVFRFSDDGEPAKTAGMPILEILRKRGLFNTLIVVTRYFGGIKLGAGGLTRAYARAAAEAVDAAGVRKFERGIVMEVTVDYPDLARVENLLRSRGRVPEKQFGERVLLRFSEKCSEREKTGRDILDATAGRAGIAFGAESFECFEISQSEGYRYDSD